MDELVERQRQHFDQISDRYAEARKHPNHLLLKHLIWQGFLARNPRLAGEVARVLEPMCGMAEGEDIVRRYLTKDFAYLGFDYSEKMVEIARHHRPGLQIERHDVTTFRATGRAFDLVILIGGLHHVYSKAGQVVRNLKESLRPGGYFLNFEPTHDNWLTRRARRKIYDENALFDADTEQGFELADLEGHFAASGFERVDVVYPGLLSYVLYYNPDAFPALNVGGGRMVRLSFALDRLFWSNRIGRKLSFATMTLWRAPGASPPSAETGGRP